MAQYIKIIITDEINKGNALRSVAMKVPLSSSFLTIFNHYSIQRALSLTGVFFKFHDNFISPQKSLKDLNMIDPNVTYFVYAFVRS